MFIGVHNVRVTSVQENLAILALRIIQARSKFY